MQPVVDTRTGDVRTFEALARLEVRGRCLAPEDFLPALSPAELDLLFRQVLGRSLSHVRDWDLDGIRAGVSVNVDPATLRDPQCISWVADALERHRIRADRLILEVLETGAVDSEEQIDTVAQVRHLGVKLAMDDFGVGYSTIARLAELPFDVVKIDQAVVDGLQRDPRSGVTRVAELVNAAVGKGCDVVAEGVENQALAEAVRLLGCGLAQGFFYAHPMPPEAVPDWLRKRSTSRRPDRVTTSLGAFAFHWTFASAGRAHPGAAADCEMMAILAEGAGEQVTRWHAEQHGDHARASSARALEGWLEARVVAG